MSYKKSFITLEFTFLCLALPTFIWTTNSGDMMFGFLWAATIYCAFVWFFINGDSLKTAPILQTLKTEWNWGAMTWANIKPILIKWIIGTILICAFTWWYEPDRFLYVPLNIPHILPFLILAYPVLSALPQEFIFCTYFMKRYGPYIEKFPAFAGMTSNGWKILLSAIVFGYAHMLFLNWIAPVFSFFGGLLFAQTYLKTKSLSLVTFEHSLYGNSIFIAGIGYYFYSGGIGQ